MTVTIDDSFYRYDFFKFIFNSPNSRQRYVIGDQAMMSLSSATVYVCGLSGVGVEIGMHVWLIRDSSVQAKNLALAGVHELIIDDSNPCILEDCATQFYIGPEHISNGLSR